AFEKSRIAASVNRHLQTLLDQAQVFVQRAAQIGKYASVGGIQRELNGFSERSFVAVQIVAVVPLRFNKRELRIPPALRFGKARCFSDLTEWCLRCVSLAVIRSAIRRAGCLAAPGE